MKPKLLLVCFCIAGLLQTNAQKPFVTTWYTKYPGVSANNQIIFQGVGTNYNIHWVNESDPADTGNAIASGTDTITFINPGTYQLYVTPGKGTFTAIKGFSYNDDSAKYGDAYKLISVDQWGDTKWSTFNYAFANCINMDINATDIPDLSEVTDMSQAFLRCLNMVGDPTMNNWDVSHVTSMQNMFLAATAFNQQIGNWDVSHVIDMSGTFFYDTSFNQPIGNWNVSNVTNMYEMFDKAYSFNQPISNWNVSQVTNMQRMFQQAYAFNQPIGNWNMSNVTDISIMFDGAVKFNQPIGNWDVSKVTDMSAMFDGASAFNQPLDNWDVSNVIEMDDMFHNDSSFNQPINNWNVSKVREMDGMFENAVAFNQPLGNLNVSNVGLMQGMFAGAKAFNQPIGNWNVSNVHNMAGMFQNSTAFNQPIGNWNVSNVESTNAMFQGATSFNQPIGNWQFGIVATDMSYMFSGAVTFNQPIGNWNTILVENLSNMFSGAVAFNQPIGKWNLAGGNLYLLNGMFKDASAFNQDISNWNVSRIYEMDSMFQGAKAFNQNLGKWNLRLVGNMVNMLDSSGMDCNNYSQTLRGWADSITQNGFALGAANLIYDSAFAKAAHDILTQIKHWTITGDKMGHCSVILPVTLIFFNVVQQGNTALLNWSVTNEINDKGYDVEKSINGINYNSIGFVAAKANKQTNYTFTDNNLTEGISYYRIKEGDNDGKYLYSSVQKVEYSKFAWRVNGNPVNNSSVTLMLNKPANVSIQVISSTGTIIKTINKGNLITGSYSIPLNINNVGAGLYMLRLMVDDKAYTSTIVKQ